MRTIQGRCLCGSVEYEVPDDFKYAGFCHCSDCRRFSGSASSAIGGIPTGALRIVRGDESIATYKKSAATVLAFWRSCGSSLYAEEPLRGMIHLRLGTLNEAPSLAPQFHSYVGSKAAWDIINDGLQQFEAGRPNSSSRAGLTPQCPVPFCEPNAGNRNE